MNLRPFPIRILSLCLLACLHAAAASAFAPVPEPAGAEKTDTATNHNLEVGKQLDIFMNVYRNLDLFYVDTLNPATTVTSAIDGMLRSLDPYTDYYPESESKDLQMMLTGKYAGIGAMVKYHLGRKNVVVDEPYEGMPAAEAGVRKGDVIVAIDDSLMEGKPVSYVSSRLRGDAGTTFVLRVLRPELSADGSRRDREMKFNITRRNIQLPSLSYSALLPDSIGYILLTQFTEGCAREVRNAFISLKEQGCKALVLDLRGNGGGSEMEAVDLVSIFVPKGELVVENRGKVAQATRRYETRLEPIDTVMPLAVLVSGETASASEITAGALQDLDRALILGTRTFGKGLVQVPLEMPYNTTVKITTSKYYIPSGRCIQAINYRRDGQGAGYKERIADSLTHVFHTRKGREVRDGGGITPDIIVKNDTMPNIAYYLSASGLDSTEVLFNYVVDYICRHPSIASASEFRLSDGEWKEFAERVAKSGFKYDLVSRRHLDSLIKAAKQEGYYEEAKPLLDSLQQKFSHNVAADLDKHRDVIQQIIEADIVSAYYFQKGTITSGLPHDVQLRRAREELLKP